VTDTLKVLGQNAPAATVLTDLYTVPGGTGVAVSSVTVCNRSATPTTFRLSVAPAGAADATSQYVYYDVPIAGNDTFVATLGITLAATDKVRCYATLATVSFSLFGVEVT
jgi:hypothetical protein